MRTLKLLLAVTVLTLSTLAQSSNCLQDHEKHLTHLLTPQEQALINNPETCEDTAEGIDFGNLEDQLDQNK